MGVPKFFRYISERYPCLSEFCLEDKIPEFDNLYLDMNGIIHTCSHPDDGNIHFRMTEEAMFRDIFKYIDKLFYLIKPQKLFFMAVDGVAPRAKMNQQRSRRFRSAKEAETLEKNAQKRGEKLPDEERFDSNCITPGTEFMVRLQKALQYFVKCKVSTNPLWRNCRIILSGHETPGEGEHKIMEYIRYLKTQPSYDPNTRHCLYGLDADLIILGLCTHELHFSLLREEVKFGRKAKPTSAEETRFYLLHLGLLREYLELEFKKLCDEISDFDIEKIIDDWILMGFLVGNDFIPHLPNLHINTNALPILYKAYIEIRPSLGGYINECGELNLERLEKYFEVLAVSEKECFLEICADLKYFQSKRLGMDNNNETFDVDVDDIKNSTIDDNLADLIKDTEMLLENDDYYDDPMSDQEEFEAYKRNYYIEKLKYSSVTPEVLAEQTECYIRALQWILYYYYRGVQSWEWFYPHHYAPFVSDMKNFKHLKIEFDIGKPFLPFEQLLAVLPAASKNLLPEAYRDLMIDPNSDVIDYYPNEFQTDLNGKKQEWEAVVLIPFIDEKKLLKAMDTCSNKLTQEEKERNKHGPMLQYDYNSESQGECEAPFSSFKTLYHVFCTEKQVWREEISVPKEKLTMENILPKPEVLKGVYFPGFPTMKFLNYKAELRNARVRVFDQPSRNDNMILIPEKREDDSNFRSVAKKYLNEIVFIGWPHLVQAKVVAVSTREIRVNAIEQVDQDVRLYELHKRTIIEHHKSRMGIDFQDLNVLIHALPSVGTEYIFLPNGKITLSKVWSKVEVCYPAQGVVSNISAYNPNFILNKKFEEVFPINSTIFMLGQPYFGSEGKILDPMTIYEKRRVYVSLTVTPEPNFSKARQIQIDVENQYVNSYEASTMLGLQANCLARITGSIFVIEGVRRDNLPENTPKINIGLQLKFPKNNEEVSGYMRKIGCTWQYSTKALELVESYYTYFPKIFELISNCTSNKDIYFESDLFSNEEIGGDALKKLVAWLKSQDHYKAERVPCGTKTMEKEAVEAVIDATEKLKTLPIKYIKVHIKPNLILKAGLNVPETIKYRKRPLELFDRVIVVKSTYQVPVGYKGTIVAVHPLTNQNSVRYDNAKEIVFFYNILFDKILPEGLTVHGLAENRVFKVCENAILEILSEGSINNHVPNNVSVNNKREVTNYQNSNNQLKTSGVTVENEFINPLCAALFKAVKNKAESENKVNSNLTSKTNSVENKLEQTEDKVNSNLTSNTDSIESKLERIGTSSENRVMETSLSKFVKSLVINSSPPPSLVPKPLAMFSSPKTFERISKQEFLNPPLASKLTTKNDDKREKSIDKSSQSFKPISKQEYFTKTPDSANNKNVGSKGGGVQNTVMPPHPGKLLQKLQKDQNVKDNDTSHDSFSQNDVESIKLKQLLGIASTSVNQTPQKQIQPQKQTDVKKHTAEILLQPPTPPQNWIKGNSAKYLKNTYHAATTSNPITMDSKSFPPPLLPAPQLHNNVISSRHPNVFIRSNYASENATQAITSTPRNVAWNCFRNSDSHDQYQSLYQQRQQHQQQQAHTQYYHNTSNKSVNSYNYNHSTAIVANQSNNYSTTNYYPTNQGYNYNSANNRNTNNQHGSFYSVNMNRIDLTKGQGAFIPLQAIKNAKKTNEQQVKQMNRNSVNSGQSQSVSEQHRPQMQSEQQQKRVEGSRSKSVQQDFTDTKIKTTKYRPPKIAAKFDHSFITQ